jgi:hypothetical protein
MEAVTGEEATAAAFVERTNGREMLVVAVATDLGVNRGRCNC